MTYIIVYATEQGRIITNSKNELISWEGRNIRYLEQHPYLAKADKRDPTNPFKATFQKGEINSEFVIALPKKGSSSTKYCGINESARVIRHWIKEI